MVSRIAVLALASLSCFAQGFDGWGKVTWGATADDVLREYATAKKDGSTIRLGELYKIGEDSFDVSFEFRDGELCRVTLSPSADGLAKMPTRKLRATYAGDLAKRLRVLLSEKYGEPSSVVSNMILPAMGSTVLWLKEGGNIRLKYGTESELLDSMTLQYERKNKALDKL